MLKRTNWINYGRKAKYLTIGVEDNFKQTITQLKLERGKNIDNKRNIKKLKEYGFDITLNEDNIEKEVEEEKKWLNKDLDW
ncbi:MAG: hypothetical protein PHX47_02495 [Candidatus ainarchaeum sp.]|nr:hypothetical protein [Candidatus ainarchaeum sp.]